MDGRTNMCPRAQRRSRASQSDAVRLRRPRRPARSPAGRREVPQVAARVSKLGAEVHGQPQRRQAHQRQRRQRVNQGLRAAVSGQRAPGDTGWDTGTLCEGGARGRWKEESDGRRGAAPHLPHVGGQPRQQRVVRGRRAQARRRRAKRRVEAAHVQAADGAHRHRHRLGRRGERGRGGRDRRGRGGEGRGVGRDAVEERLGGVVQSRGRRRRDRHPARESGEGGMLKRWL
jgi:hypothetical protein